jgi:pilus assembly protein CpaE
MKEFKVVLAGEEGSDPFSEDMLKEAGVTLRIEHVALANLQDTLMHARPQLLIYSGNGNIDLVERTAKTTSQMFSDLPWAVVADEAEGDSVVRFFRMGAVDFLKRPVQSTDVKRLVDCAVQADHQKRTNEKKEHHHLISVFSTKGGVGLTTIAVNLTVELVKRKLDKMLLMDLVLQHGNVSDFLDFSGSYTFTDVMENFDRLDSNLLNKSLNKHAAGFSILPCPKQPEDEESISAKQTTEVFKFLKGMFQYVVADVGHEFSKTAISYLDVSDMILLVTTPDVPSICNARAALETFRRLGYPPEKTKLVVNRWKMKGEVDTPAIEKNLATQVFARLPEDHLICLGAANQGKAIAEISKNGDIRKGFQQLASSLIKLTEKGQPHVTS